MFDRRNFLLAASTLPLSACVGGRLASRPLGLRVATFNIWHDMGDWTPRQLLLVHALREVNADVIALQEVLEDANKGLPNQAETLARALGGYSVHFFSTDPEGAPRRYGNAILSRSSILAETARKLEPLDDYRTAVRVRVRSENRPIDFVVTHLAWQDDAGPVRARQVADLLAWLPNEGVPLVVMGDFNAPLSDKGLAALILPRFESALPSGSAVTTLNPAKGHPNRVIDHIFAERKYFSVKGARVIGDRPIHGDFPSDHFGVAATLSFR